MAWFMPSVVKIFTVGFYVYSTLVEVPTLIANQGYCYTRIQATVLQPLFSGAQCLSAGKIEYCIHHSSCRVTLPMVRSISTVENESNFTSMSRGGARADVYVDHEP